MHIIFFFFRSRYRYSHVGNLFVTRQCGRLRFIPVVGIWAVVLEPLLHHFSRLFRFSLIYTDKEFPSRRGRFRLWWNTPEELGPEYLNRSPLMVCGNPVRIMPRCQFYPVMPEVRECPSKTFGAIRAVYMGEVQLPNDPMVVLAWSRWRDALLEDLTLLTTVAFWDHNFVGVDDAERYALYRGFSNLIRFECVQALQAAGVPIALYGRQWRDLGISSAEDMFDADERRRLYRGNLCLDFGSKSGSDSLYQRTIEVVENGGLLIQARRADSARVFGVELAERITFRRLVDLPGMISDLLQDPGYCQQLQDQLQMQFAQNKNLDPQTAFSLAAVMGAAS